MSNLSPSSRSLDTRQRLLRAAVRVFAELGFEAASTRQLASQAGVNLAAIPYHFESKKGLYLAVAEHVADQIGAHLAPALSSAAAQLDGGLDDSQARSLLRELQQRMLHLVVGEPQADAWAGFILREQAQPTDAFDLLYERTMGRVIDVFTRLLGQLTGTRPDDPVLKIRSIALLGQLLIFRTSRAGVLRALEWNAYTDKRIEILASVIDEHTDMVIRELESADA